MKPIIIIKEKNTNGKFEFTENELKELIEQAYAQGVADEKKTQPNIPYRPIEWGNGQRNIGTTNPHDIYGNPVPYCGTTSDPRDNQITLTPLTTKLNDLVYRPSTAKWAKQGEPNPCELKQQTSGGVTSLGSLPDYRSTAIGTADSAVLKEFSKQPNKDLAKLVPRKNPPSADEIGEAQERNEK